MMSNLFSPSIQEKQSLISQFFEQALQKNALSNAYLFLGSSSQDKLDFAKELTMILNCESNLNKSIYNPACHQCTNCKWISTDTHPATPIFLQPKEDSKKSIIAIEQIKNLQMELSKSSEYYRVMIVAEANYNVLNKHSANALLKAVEEPNHNILFLFFAEDKDVVLPTIVSRTQQLKFNSSIQNTKEVSEEAKELFEQFYRRLEEAILTNAFGKKSPQEKLDCISLAEELAGSDNKVLLEFLELVQKEYNDNLKNHKDQQQALFLSKNIFAIEKAKSDLRSFVRPKAAFEQLFFAQV